MRWLPWIAAAALAALPAAAREPRKSECGTCHPQSRVEFASSIHANEEVSCVDCHGGDPASRSVEAAHRRGFRALDNRAQVPGLCAECHADLDRMRPYNLPVDQYAVYQTSQHGRAVARGELRAAVCSDCHGVHDIRRPADPASRANRLRLAETCNGCHGDPQLMDNYGIDPTVVEEYLQGRHGVALLREGKSAAPSCSDCHGVHGATPPGVGDIDKVCGSCHEDTRRAFLAGPHYEAMRAAGLPECAACHSNHRVRSVAQRRLTEVCADCHEEGSDPLALGAKMEALVKGAAEEIRQAEELAVKAGQGPVHIEDHLSRIEQAHTYLTEVPPLLHAVSLGPVEEVTRRARSIGEEVRHELYEKLDRSTAHLLLAVVWFYLLMTLVILLIYRRRLRRQGGVA